MTKTERNISKESEWNEKMPTPERFNEGFDQLRHDRDEFKQKILTITDLNALIESERESD